MRWNLPILLTWLRMLAIPLLVAVYLVPAETASMPTRNLLGTVVFVAAAITDWVDGWLARRLGQTTAFGAFLDPVADKLLVCAALVLLLELQRVAALVAIIIVGREIAISALREWMAEIGQRTKVAVSRLGKYKTILQIVGLSMMLYRWDLFSIPMYRLGFLLTGIAAVLTLVSMVEYLRAAWPDLRGSA